MIRNAFQKLLLHSGKNYDVDPAIPERLLFRILFCRIIMLLRGFLKTGKKVYVGGGCTILNSRNISFGKNVTIEQNSIIDGYARNVIYFGDGAKIGAYSKLTCTSHLSKYGKGFKIGSNSAVGDFAHFGAAGGIEIGNDVIMGSAVSFHSENHNFENNGVLIREQGVTSKGIIISDNVWIGSKVTFLDGSNIGSN